MPLYTMVLDDKEHTYAFTLPWRRKYPCNEIRKTLGFSPLFYASKVLLTMISLRRS
jgi:hypothetical protein